MEFEQIAIKANSDFTVQIPFTEAGSEWTRDTVHAKGVLLNGHAKMSPVENLAELRFNYTVFPGKEFELIHYTDGPNFLDEDTWVGNLSHFGVHVPKINDFRTYFDEKQFQIVQEVITLDHRNVPKDKHYRYAIFRHSSMDFHWKLIERLNGDAEWLKAQADLEWRYDYVIF